ncbi:methylmalonyl Co-A mutase-associated GTPase MeaB [Flavobacteriaceae bacterium]|nr:methylmalonyl Co-A mutase-associated GTPase MeaB [Flavobacteriaceae bacterium]
MADPAANQSPKDQAVSKRQEAQSNSVHNIKIARGIAPTTAKLYEQILKGDTAALSRGITLIESAANKHQNAAQNLLSLCLPHSGKSLRIGVTGVPGVGKSTLIEQLGLYLIQQGKRVAVLAIDPTSSISQGSILGDKTRMEQLTQQKEAFIRPTPSRLSLGGVARHTREAIVLCEAAHYDVILIETVGVGQSETTVHEMTDFFLLLQLAGAGDGLQGIKRGIIEMADAIVINKADGNNIKAAENACMDYKKALALFPDKTNTWKPQTMVCSALENQGISELWDMICVHEGLTRSNGSFEQQRRSQNIYWMQETIKSRLQSDFFDHPKIKKGLPQEMKAVSALEKTPFEAANNLLKLIR